MTPRPARETPTAHRTIRFVGACASDSWLRLPGNWGQITMLLRDLWWNHCAHQQPHRIETRTHRSSAVEAGPKLSELPVNPTDGVAVNEACQHKSCSVIALAEGSAHVLIAARAINQPTVTFLQKSPVPPPDASLGNASERSLMPDEFSNSGNLPHRGREENYLLAKCHSCRESGDHQNDAETRFGRENSYEAGAVPCPFWLL